MKTLNTGEKYQFTLVETEGMRATCKNTGEKLDDTSLNFWEHSFVGKLQRKHQRDDKFAAACHSLCILLQLPTFLQLQQACCNLQAPSSTAGAGGPSYRRNLTAEQ